MNLRDKLALVGTERGDMQMLIWDKKEVGIALRTQSTIKPMFVSIGHKIATVRDKENDSIKR